MALSAVVESNCFLGTYLGIEAVAAIVKLPSPAIVETWPAS